MNTTTTRPQSQPAREDFPPPPPLTEQCEAPGQVDIKSELTQALQNLKESLVPLWHAFTSLVIAQVKLTKIMISERVRLKLARGILLLHIWLLAGLAWLFLNMGLWRAVMALDPSGIAAPFVIFLVQMLAILGAIAYYRSLRI